MPASLRLFLVRCRLRGGLSSSPLLGLLRRLLPGGGFRSGSLLRLLPRRCLRRDALLRLLR